MAQDSNENPKRKGAREAAGAAPSRRAFDVRMDRLRLRHLRLLDLIAALEAAHGLSAPLVAARLIATSALARQESRGGHFRADFTGSQAPRRTLLTLRDIAQPALRFAAE